MKFLSTSMAVAAVLACSALVSASSDSFEQSNVHDIARRASHKKHKTCSSKKSAAARVQDLAAKHSSKKHHTTSAKKHHHTTSAKHHHHTTTSEKHKAAHTSSKAAAAAKATHKTASTESTASTSEVTLNGGKMGLAWANSDGMPISNFDFGPVSWFYSWSTQPGWANAPVDKLMYCPMLWGDKMTGDFQTNVLDNQNGKFNQHKCAMGMNEVNQVGQANMSPADGCAMMEKYLMPLKDNGWYIIGPSTTSAPDGKVWYQNFQKLCPAVFNKIDSIAIHYYGTSANDFETYLKDWHTTFGKDLWVTEFACQNFNGGAQCSKDETNAFANQMATFMNAQDWIKGWAPFAVIQNLQGVSETQRLSNGNNPTALYHAYAAAQ